MGEINFGSQCFKGGKIRTTTSLPWFLTILEQQRKEVREMLDDRTTRDQRMLFGLVTLVHFAHTKEELDNLLAMVMLTCSNLRPNLP